VSRAALLLAAVLLAGCGGGGSASGEGIVAGLESHGVKVESPQPEPPGVLEVPSRVYQIPGGTLHVFAFASADAAREAQARIEPDGYTIRNTSGINQSIDWAATPHWFRDAREIAVYIGTSTDVTNALSEVAGPQFAGA
jgi:hypothetical protein